MLEVVDPSEEEREREDGGRGELDRLSGELANVDADATDLWAQTTTCGG